MILAPQQRREQEQCDKLVTAGRLHTWHILHLLHFKPLGWANLVSGDLGHYMKVLAAALSSLWWLLTW